MLIGATVASITLATTSPALTTYTKSETAKAIEIKSPELAISEIAVLKGISVSDMLFLARSEGGYSQNPCIQSNIIDKNGNRENSWGAFQINLDWHPKVTKEQACDLVWSANWTADRILEGHIGWWTSIWNQN